MAYDVKCLDLAQYFLGCEGHEGDPIQASLAQRIQDAVEEWMAASEAAQVNSCQPKQKSFGTSAHPVRAMATGATTMGNCPHCFESSGYVWEHGNDWNSGPWSHQTNIPCRECNGTGNVEMEDATDDELFEVFDVAFDALCSGDGADSKH